MNKIIKFLSLTLKQFVITVSNELKGVKMELNNLKIQQNYKKILEDIEKYSPYSEKVKILFVSKYLNIEEHKALIEMGYDYFGENRAQLYRDKLNEFSGEKYKNIKWDFIGRLQKNKIKYIINSVNLIHSIDSYELLEEINKKAIENNRIINGLIEINVSKEESKTGVYIEDFKKNSEKYFSMSNVKIIGFMTMAPFEASEAEINSYFSNMRDLKEEYQKKYDYITTLSMGMSNDYVEALKNGTTIIRIGSKLFK